MTTLRDAAQQVLDAIESGKTFDHQRKPLTDEEIDRLTHEQWGVWNYPLPAHRAYARAIERAHGIT